MTSAKTPSHFRLPFWLPWLGFVYPRVILLTALLVTLLYVAVVGATADGIYHYDADTSITRLVEHIFQFPAAIAGGELIPLARVRLQVAALQVHDAAGGQPLSRGATESIVTNQIIDRTLFRQALLMQGTHITPRNIDQQLALISKSVGGEDKLTAFLDQQYGPTMTLKRFRDWVVADSLAEAAVQQQLLVRATVSHILVAVPANAPADQVEAARLKVVSIKAKLAASSQFADVAKQYSDDVASRDNGGQLGTTVRGNDNAQYSPSFETAIFTLPVGQVSDPIRSQYGWHLILITKREGNIDLSLAQYAAKLRQDGHAKIFLLPR